MAQNDNEHYCRHIINAVVIIIIIIEPATNFLNFASYLRK
jgi:CO dehydrogenase nickel-insertion accessory protein CooC1